MLRFFSSVHANSGGYMSRRVLFVVGCLVPVTFLFAPSPAAAANYASYASTVTASNGMTCDLFADLDGNGGSVSAFVEIDCDSAVNRVTTGIGNPIGTQTPRVVETLNNIVIARTADMGTSTSFSSYESDSAAISPRVSNLTYQLRHITFAIVASGPSVTFTSYPSHCLTNTHPSTGYQRVICNPTDLQI